MMQPLSKRKRLGYLVLSCLLFVILAPSAILYARGYRLTDSFEITRTGGLYASVGLSGAQVYLDNVLVKETGIFQKGALIQNLKPDTYTIRVEKDGLHSWEKTLPVFRETVTDVRTLMLPLEPEIIEILPKKKESGEATSTKTIAEDNPQYEQAIELFTAKKTASSTEEKLINKLSAEKEEEKVIVTWLGDEGSRPSYFCLGEECQEEIIVSSKSGISSFYFMPGRDDLIIFQTRNGIYVSEIDSRSTQNIQPIWEKWGLELRVSDNTIYIKDGKRYYTTSL
ncbi:MAG: hypothetical protein ABIF06_01095 [bacterium]